MGVEVKELVGVPEPVTDGLPLAVSVALEVTLPVPVIDGVTLALAP